MNNRWSKLIRSLHRKKNRLQEQMFFVEGEKVILELLESDFDKVALFATEKFIAKYTETIHLSDKDVYPTLEKDLLKAGTFQSNNAGILVLKTKPFTIQKEKNIQGLNIVLDDVRDPGNLGTIVRIADWYGIKNIICSKETVDIYNPKVIASTMGAIGRVNVIYTELSEFLNSINAPIFFAEMSGKSAHTTPLPKDAVLVMGNESNGVSDEIKKIKGTSITIPRFGKSESLNVAIATAILCDNFKKQ